MRIHICSLQKGILTIRTTWFINIRPGIGSKPPWLVFPTLIACPISNPIRSRSQTHNLPSRSPALLAGLKTNLGWRHPLDSAQPQPQAYTASQRPIKAQNSQAQFVFNLQARSNNNRKQEEERKQTIQSKGQHASYSHAKPMSLRLTTVVNS